MIDLDVNDNSQIIFETLNARGTPLLASDLIKNAVFHRSEELHLATEELYAQYWRDLDHRWWREEVTQGRLRRPRLDVFFFHWLTMRRGEEIGVHELFPEFKQYLAGESSGPEPVLHDISHHASTYREFERYPTGTREESFFYRLRATQTTTVMPLLLRVFGASDTAITPEQRDRILEAIESWLIRRMLCRLTTKNYNVVFLNLLKTVRDEIGSAGDAAVAFFRGLDGESQIWPTDEEVRTALTTLPLYRVLGQGRLRVVLEAIESWLRPPHVEEPSPPRGLTIEHVMPQAWGTNWPLPADRNTLENRLRRETLVHSLGNLTLVTGKLNPKLSNEPWEIKRETLEDHTVLFLNRQIVEHERWDEDAIIERSNRLTDAVLGIWAGPESGSWGSEIGRASCRERV